MDNLIIQQETTHNSAAQCGSRNGFVVSVIPKTMALKVSGTPDL